MELRVCGVCPSIFWQTKLIGGEDHKLRQRMTCRALADEIRTVFDQKFKEKHGDSKDGVLTLIEPSTEETPGASRRPLPWHRPRPQHPVGKFADWGYVMFEPHYTWDLCEWAQTAMDLILHLKRTDPAGLDTRINMRGGHHPRWWQNTYEKSALHYAVSNGFPSLVRVLLSVPGVDVDIRDLLGRSPLSEALVGHYNVQIVIELVRAGADFGVPDEKGQTPLHMAILFRCGDWLPILVMDHIRGYDYRHRDAEGRTLLEWVKYLGTVEPSIVAKIEEKMASQVSGD